MVMVIAASTAALKRLDIKFSTARMSPFVSPSRKKEIDIERGCCNDGRGIDNDEK